MDYSLHGGCNKRLNNFRATIFEQYRAFTRLLRCRPLFYDAIHVTCRIARLCSRWSCKFDRVISELQLSRLAFRRGAIKNLAAHARIFRVECGSAYVLQICFITSRFVRLRGNRCYYSFSHFDKFWITNLGQDERYLDMYFFK